MNEFFELEKKCKKLQRKKIIKIIFYFILISLVCIALIFGYHYLTTPKPTKTSIIKPKKIEHKTTKPIKKVKPIVKPKPKIKKESLATPTLDLQINLNDITQPKIQKKKTITKKQPIKKVKPIVKPKPKLKPKLKPKPKPKPKKLLQDETISFDKAMRLAKLYYDNMDYQNSMKWCKFASKIDNNDENVWKLYALNLSKIGQKQKAIKVLKTYLKYRDSKDLQYLLQRLEK